MACTLTPSNYYYYPFSHNGQHNLYANSHRTSCGQSYYCPAGTAQPASITQQSAYGINDIPTCPPWYDCVNFKMCDDGKYLDNDKVTCRNCEAGQVCRLRYQNGRVDVTRPGTQFGNYYSPTGVSAQFICPGGFECHNNVAVACSAGEYSGEGDLYCRECP